ncbi:MAG: glycosyltransferase [Hyphomonadaceae bacterium]
MIFLSPETVCPPGLTRTDRGLELQGPWATIRVPGVHLLRGWWRLEADAGASPAPDIEVRASCALDPLIVFRTGPSGSAMIFLQGEGDYDFNVVLGPWPGVVQLQGLRLVRQSTAQKMRLYASAARRLLSNDRPVFVLWRAIKRIAAGRSLGLAAPPPAEKAPTAPAATAAPPSPPSPPPAIDETQSSDNISPDIRVLMYPGDRLAPEWESVVRQAFEHNPECDALYGDVVEAGHIVPKPEWDEVLANACNYIGAPVFLRGGSPLAGQVEDAEQAFAQVRRLGGAGLGRIALPLASRDAEPPRLVRPACPDLERAPKVSVILPTKYRVDLLEKALRGLVETTDYPDLEVVLVDNGCEHPDFPGLVARMGERLQLKHLKIIQPFNFSSLINQGERAADGELLLLLNDDIEPVHADWLNRIVASALDETAGAVGARLLFPDRTIQHAGVYMGIGGVCGHLWKGTPEARWSRMPQLVMPSTRMAVTGACLAVRRDRFHAVGGFDEDLAVAFNDIDFCLKLHAQGLRNIYRGDAELIHHESQSRPVDHATLATTRRLTRESALMYERWRSLLGHDPWSSPAFDPSTETGALHPGVIAPWRGASRT